MSDYYPPAGYSFRLQMVSPAAAAEDAGFQEVSGLSMEMDTENYREGGQNLFTHCLPSGVKGGRLVLKRGLIVLQKALYNWCAGVLQGGLVAPVQVKNFNLQLLANNSTDEAAVTAAGATVSGAGDVLKAWTLYRVWPLKWEVSGLDALRGHLVVESLELSYAYFCPADLKSAS